ncbi:MAG: hypothetical protein QM630_02830 [Microbacterium sp.]
MLQKIRSSPSGLWLGRGTHGMTTQEVTVAWNGFEADVTVKRIHQGTVTAHLDKVELEALVTWINDRIVRASEP